MPTTTDNVIAERVDVKVMPDGTYVRATSRLYQIQGNKRPHFSVTGEQWQTLRHYNRRTERETGLLGMGAMHETILEAFPYLEPVVAVHLADDYGTPMHAVANGWYFYSDAYQGTLEQAARALHIDPAELPEGLDRDGFEAFAESLRPRWKQQAERALAVIERGPDA
jgi:hypothetical protein